MASCSSKSPKNPGASKSAPSPDKDSNAGTKESKPDGSFSRQMVTKYYRSILADAGKFINHYELIDSKYPGYLMIPKSRVLDDEKLCRTVLFGKLLEDYPSYEANRQNLKGELIWVHINDKDEVLLVSEDRIIYSMVRSRLDFVREYLLRPFVAKCSGAADAATPSGGGLRLSMKDELKRMVLVEMNRFKNMDPLLKKKLLNDLNEMGDKDVYFWCGILDSIRDHRPEESYLEFMLRKVSMCSKDMPDLQSDPAQCIEQMEADRVKMRQFADELRKLFENSMNK